MDLTVSEAMAVYFYEQCAGEYAGHMSMIPNNPVLAGVVKAHRAEGKHDFARFLRQIADKLETQPPF